jgi:GTP-binding protein Era
VSEESGVKLETIEDETPEGHKSGFVAVVGRPNSGKSTLMNALLQQKVAIVSPLPQTTRKRQLGILTTPSYQMVFIDTPGLIKPRHKLDEFMVDAAVEAFQDADVILWIIDATEAPGAGEQAIAGQLAPLAGHCKIILGLNKIDLLKPDQVIPASEAYRALLPDADWLMFSALEQRGLDELMQMLLDGLPEGPRYYPVDQVTDAYLRDIAADMIREQVMMQMREEVPYGTAVQIEEFKERDNGVTYISATIYVERENHKKMLIGQKGEQLRDIGAAARQEIERLIEGKVFLELWVKAEPKWRRNEHALKRFGYAKP